jgi:S-phase kinase-associated protein 1
MEAKTKKLKSSDNVVKEVEIDLLMKSKLLKGLIEDYQGDDEEIPLNEVDAKNLELIIEYLTHYKDTEPKEIPKPFPERTDEDFLKGILNDEWTYTYLTNQSLEGLINLVNAANYLQIDGLINIIAAKLAHEMCNCEVEEARKKFGIECDMTEEEIAEIDKYPLD